MEAALTHLYGSTGFKPTMQLQYNIQTALQLAQSESTFVKALDIPPIINIEKLRELFSFYGHIVSLEFREEHGMCNALIKFKTAAEAEKSLAASGILVGDRELRVEKWIDHSVTQSIQMNVLTTSTHSNCKTLSSSREKHLSDIAYDLLKANPDQWKKIGRLNKLNNSVGWNSMPLWLQHQSLKVLIQIVS